jgi:hypothetical protein
MNQLWLLYLLEEGFDNCFASNCDSLINAYPFQHFLILLTGCYRLVIVEAWFRPDQGKDFLNSVQKNGFAAAGRIAKAVYLCENTDIKRETFYD